MYAKNKKGQMHFTKIYGIDLLLNFEGKHVSSAIIFNNDPINYTKRY